jgi:charged multivesicular body protein 7
MPARILSYVVGKPLWWALEQLGAISEERHSPSKEKDWRGEYVVRVLVEKAADEVEARQKEKYEGVSGGLYSLEGFKKEFEGVLKDVVLSEVDVKVLIRYLERDRRVVVLDREVSASAFCISLMARLWW